MRLCEKLSAKKHPARFPPKLPEFFINFLTDENDLVVDIFAGSNTTGAVAEANGRKWLACDLDRDYLVASAFRFFYEPLDDLQIDIFRRLSESDNLPVYLSDLKMEQIICSCGNCQFL